MVLGVPILRHFRVILSGYMYHKALFSLPGRSPGRAVVLPPASALALVSALAAASALAKC